MSSLNKTRKDITIHIPGTDHDSFFYQLSSGNKTIPIPIPHSQPSSSRLSTAFSSPTSPEDGFLEFKLRKLLAQSSDGLKASLLHMLVEDSGFSAEQWCALQDAVNAKSNKVLGYERYIPVVQSHKRSSSSLAERPVQPCPIESRIPDELLMLIFANLDAPSLSAAAQVNRRWNRVLHDNMLWQQLCLTHQFLGPIRHHFSTLPPVHVISPGSANTVGGGAHSGPTSALSTRLRQRSRVADGFAGPATPLSPSPWKSQFRDNYLTWCNWRRGTYRSSAIMDKYRGGRGNLCVGFDDEQVLSVALGDDGRIWDMRTGLVKYRLRGHNGMITTVKFDNGFFVTGGVDGAVKIWDTTTGQCLLTLVGHEGEIVCVQYDDHIVLAGSEDCTIRSWDRLTGKPSAVLRGHEGAVTALHFDGDFVASGSVDHTIKLWSLKQAVCLRTLHGHESTVYSLQLNADYIVSGSEDHTMRIWSRFTGEQLRVLSGHTGAVVCLQFDSDKIVSGGNDGTVKVWNFNTGKLLYSLSEHSGGIWNLKFDKTKIMTSSFDQSIRIWDFASVSSMSI